MRLLLPTVLLILVAACTAPPTTRSDWARHYGGRQGAFVLYELRGDTYSLYEPRRCSTAFIPASTFKIFNSLVALETAVVPDAAYVLPWDSIQRFVPAWNRDHDLHSAFQNSVVWYYQEVARQIGTTRMQAYVDQEQYGNGDISGGIDQFWLSGGLRISPLEQVELLKKLYLNQLHFSQRSMDIVKEIMVVESTEAYTLRAKTGWSTGVEPHVGWYVGYLERGDQVWFFANYLEMPPQDQGAARARIDIARAILKEMGLLTSEE